MLYAITDVETTGGSAKTSKITEIAIYKHDGEKILDSFVTLVNPEMPIPEFITRLTGIHNHMVKDSPKFFEIARQIIEFTEDCIFVAHNVGFDYGMIRHEFKQLGYDFRKPHLCTVRASRVVIPGHESYSLGKLTKDLGISINGRHRAGGDAFATAELFGIMFGKDKMNLETFIQHDVNPKILHPSLDLEALEEIPNKTGVYKFYNEFNQLIYIGKSKHIRTRIDQHLKNTKTQKGSVMRQEIARIEFELTGSELIALLYESELIKAHKPVYNRALRRNNFNYGLFRYSDEFGYSRLFIEKITKNSELPLTTFITKREGSEFLHYLVEKHQLCTKLCSLDHSTHACFNYQIRNCHGACIQAENIDDYNDRVETLAQSLTFDEQHFYLVEPGRDKREKSVILVQNGSYKGFGYVPFYLLKEHPKSWQRFIDLRPEDRDCRTILRFWLRRNPDIVRKTISRPL